MFKTFRTAFALKNTYRVNGIIYAIRRTFLVGKLVPVSLYRSQGLKVFANILSVAWEVISAFLGKCLYLLVLMCGLGELLDKAPQWQVFLYYAISLMRMNARTYMLSFYIYAMLRVVVGFLPFTILFGRMSGVPLWICLLLPLFVAGGKLCCVWIYLVRYERTGRNPDENKLNKWDWILAAVLLAAAYGLPCLGIVIPWQAIVALMLLAILGGALSVKKVARFPFYRELCQMMLAEKKSGLDPKVTSQKLVQEASRKKISTDVSITSKKKGFEYFNELFIKRHRRILWNSARRVTIGALVAAAAGAGACLLNGQAAQVVNESLMRLLPVFLFVMYALNRGTAFTQALFMNCDHSMLTYSFYKKPGTILRLFWIRLREITKINLAPAAVIGLGLSLLLYVSGGTGAWIKYVILPVSILALSVFFSVHSLTLYYLLQPYNAETELQSGTYKLLSWVTYLFCFMFMQVRMSSLVFGAAMIIFSLLYCAVAGVLVYKYAGRTFRLRN